MASALINILLLIFSRPPIPSSTHHHRRALHPSFPLLSIPSPPAAGAPPPTSPLPFFPLYPSPPAPANSFHTLPTNVTPTTTTATLPPPRPAATHNLATLVALPVAALFILTLTLFVILLRRRSSHGGNSRRFFPSDSGRKLPTTAADDDDGISSPPSASEFLYLGTVVSSRAPATSAAKLSTPELRPLPPLARRVSGCSSDEEFYSPNGGGSPAAASSFQNAAFTATAASPVSTLSSPSHLSSSPPISSSAGRSTVRSPPSSTGFVPPPPPPPPPPRPLVPLPSNRGFDRNSKKLPSQTGTGDLANNPIARSSPPRRPPPPPPLPPARHWENDVMTDRGPPVLRPPRPMTAKKPVAPVRPTESTEKEAAKPRLKALHWDKVQASSDRSTAWDRMKSSSFELNEDMIAALFGYEVANVASKETVKQQLSLLPNQENRVLDRKKYQNIAILLRAVNVTKEEVCEALLEGNTDSLGNEILETLLKMTPSKKEEIQLKEYKDDSQFKLGPAEKFLKAVLDIPFAFKRADSMLYISNFENDANYLRNSFGTLEAACQELRSSRLFLKLLEAILKTGNRMNVGTNRGDAQAFKLDTLLKLVDVKGTDGKTTLLHFVVEEITKAEGLRSSAADLSTTKSCAGALRDDLECRKLGLQVVSGLGSELGNVTKAAAMDSDVLSSLVFKLANGIGKIIEVQKLNSELGSKEKGWGFHDAMNRFLKKAEDEIIKLQAQERISMGLVKELTVYFHGDSAKVEAQPFRIFMVVRDFLRILDQVCQEVGRINQRNAVSSKHHIPVPPNPSQLPFFPVLHALKYESSDDESF